MYVYKGNPNNMRQRFNYYGSEHLTTKGKIKKPKKRIFTCIDGVLKGYELALTEPFTMIMNINGEKGRYIQSTTENTLEWEQCK